MRPLGGHESADAAAASSSPYPAIWMVRAGRGAQLAEVFEDRKLVALGRLPYVDVSGSDVADIVERICATSRTPVARARHIAAMLHRFVLEPSIGDRVLTPTARTESLLLGEITGPYQFRPELEEAPHTRAVAWAGRLPRERIDAEQMHTMGAPMAFQKPHRQDVLRRLFGDKPYSP